MLPIYASVLGDFTPSTAKEVRRHLFATMIMSYLEMGYQMNIITEADLREEGLRSPFRGEPMRKWWTVAGKYWTGNPKPNRRARKFARIAEEEYNRAVETGPPIVRTIDDSSPDAVAMGNTERWTIPASMVLGIAIGVLVRSRLWGHQR
jgi:hypothetical protein